MKLVTLTFLGCLCCIHAETPQAPQLDELLSVFEITRHGARFGLGKDYFNETSPAWRSGELTQIGKRQHYLMGQEMRKRYIDD